MRILVWSAFSVLSITWTFCAVVAAQLVQWATQIMGSGAAEELSRANKPWPGPAWLASWLDPAVIKATQEALLSGFEAFRTALSWAASTVGWLVPLVWISWGIGMIVLLAMTVGIIRLASNRTPAPFLR